MPIEQCCLLDAFNEDEGSFFLLLSTFIYVALLLSTSRMRMRIITINEGIYCGLSSSKRPWYLVCIPSRLLQPSTNLSADTPR